MSQSPVILLAEDLEDDILLITEAFEQAFVPHQLAVVRNGEEAIEYLTGSGKCTDRQKFPFPALLLLDLRMPRMDGFEVLLWLRQQPALRGLRVVVLTSSNRITDVNRAYQLGAHSFLVKPSDFENTLQLIKDLTQYWLVASETPSSPAAGALSAPTAASQGKY
jgi:CheY-like chemotaxis protein